MGTHPAAPEPAARNDAYYDSTARRSYVFDGVEWQILAQDGAPGPAAGGAGGGGSFAYPDGIEQRTPITVCDDSYTVPAGFNLYITAVYLDDEELQIEGCRVRYGRANLQSGDFPAMVVRQPLLVGSGQTVSFPNGGTFNGFIVPARTTPVTHCGPPGYTVPQDTMLTVLNVYQGDGLLRLDGCPVLYGYVGYQSGRWHGVELAQPLLAAGGQELVFSEGGTINGYLQAAPLQ